MPGEAVFVVLPLGVPAESADEADLALSPAVRLFVDRASAARAGSEVWLRRGRSGASAGRWTGCRWRSSWPPPGPVPCRWRRSKQHLADKFRFLAHRRPVADARHQTLKAAIDWSYQLLPAPERAFFRALSVFAGGFRLAAAAAVCCAGDEAAALDLVDSLVSKSLVVAEPSAAGTRYRLLETIREYAADRLAEAGEADEAMLRHTAVYLGLAELVRDPTALSGEHDNFRAALEWSLAREDVTGPRLAAALGGFWLARGFYQEGQAGWSAAWRRPRPAVRCAPSCSGCSGRCCMRPGTWNEPALSWRRECGPPKQLAFRPSRPVSRCSWRKSAPW